MRTLPGLLTLLALSCTGAAHAQAPTLTQAQSDEAHCIVLRVPEGDINEEIVLAYLDDSAAGLSDEASTAIVSAEEDCTSEYMWDADAQNYAVTLSLAYISVDWLVHTLHDSGVPGSVVENLQPVIAGLTDDEQTAVFLRQWEGDTALQAKLRRLLLAQGAPDDEGKILLLIQLLENSLVYSTQLQRFVDRQFT